MLRVKGTPMHSRFEPLKRDHKKPYCELAEYFLLFSKSMTWPILHALCKKGMTLSEISKNLKMAQKAVLSELVVLQSKNILISFSKSHRIYYRLADDRIIKAMDLMHKICQRKVAQAGSNGPGRKPSRNSRNPA
jgi:hypothetical protein